MPSVQHRITQTFKDGDWLCKTCTTTRDGKSEPYLNWAKRVECNRCDKAKSKCCLKVLRKESTGSGASRPTAARDNKTGGGSTPGGAASRRSARPAAGAGHTAQEAESDDEDGSEEEKQLKKDLAILEGMVKRGDKSHDLTALLAAKRAAWDSKVAEKRQSKDPDTRIKDLSLQIERFRKQKDKLGHTVVENTEKIKELQDKHTKDIERYRELEEKIVKHQKERQKLQEEMAPKKSFDMEVASKDFLRQMRGRLNQSLGVAEMPAQRITELQQGISPMLAYIENFVTEVSKWSEKVKAETAVVQEANREEAEKLES